MQMLPTSEPLLMTPTEAASLLKLSRAKVYELIRLRQLPSIRIGGTIRVPVDALREHVARELTSQASEAA